MSVNLPTMDGTQCVWYSHHYLLLFLLVFVFAIVSVVCTILLLIGSFGSFGHLTGSQLPVSALFASSRGLEGSWLAFSS